MITEVKNMEVRKVEVRKVEVRKEVGRKLAVKRAKAGRVIGPLVLLEEAAPAAVDLKAVIAAAAAWVAVVLAVVLMVVLVLEVSPAWMITVLKIAALAESGPLLISPQT